jgi:hypothetical protein
MSRKSAILRAILKMVAIKTWLKAASSTKPILVESALPAKQQAEALASESALAKVQQIPLREASADIANLDPLIRRTNTLR